MDQQDQDFSGFNLENNALSMVFTDFTGVSYTTGYNVEMNYISGQIPITRSSNQYYETSWDFWRCGYCAALQELNLNQNTFTQFIPSHYNAEDRAQYEQYLYAEFAQYDGAFNEYGMDVVGEEFNMDNVNFYSENFAAPADEFSDWNFEYPKGEMSVPPPTFDDSSAPEWASRMKECEEYKRIIEGFDECTSGGITQSRHSALRNLKKLGNRCSNCGVNRSTLWRRDSERQVVCNACGVYYKLHKRKRPIYLNKNSIHVRKRRRNKSFK